MKPILCPHEKVKPDRETSAPDLLVTTDTAGTIIHSLFGWCVICHSLESDHVMSFRDSHFHSNMAITTAFLGEGVKFTKRWPMRLHTLRWWDFHESFWRRSTHSKNYTIHQLVIAPLMDQWSAQIEKEIVSVSHTPQLACILSRK